jgi:hypothetical protein
MELEKDLGRTELCPICKTRETSHLDHCHKTGSWRGWLCAGCNQGLGFFLDDPNILRTAAIYIENFLETLARGNPARGEIVHDYRLQA